MAVHLIVDNAFCPISPHQGGYDAPLVIHARPDSSHDHLAVFLHGLGGRRYATWGELPRFLFEDCGELDVGLYDFADAFLRAVAPSTTLDGESYLCADQRPR
jgi:hypothetical protein